jgi:regulator of cell morphogenesis and NO signaling
MPATTETLSQLAIAIPGATGVLRKYKLDFCCGGAVSLAEAAAAKGLDAEAIAGELQALAPIAAETPTEPAALISHILTRYHETHRRELPELIRLAKRVEAVHGARPDAPKGLAAILVPFARDLDDHMRKEEMVLFPMMEDGGNDFIRHPIGAMRAEHIETGAALKQIEAFAGEPPADACATWRALNAGLAKFCDDLMNHIHLENNLLFPMFETAGHHEGCGCGH